jgi:flagellar biosynthetic protein FlhB
MADSGDNAQEKTEPATPKRLDEAKRKGQVARSRELTTSALLLAAAGGLLALGPGLVTRLLDLMRAALRTNPVADGAPGVEQALLEAMADALLAVAPFLALSAVVATLAPLALGGWVLSPEAIAFKWEKLDPIKGLGRVFSWRGLMELTKALAKFTLILSVTGLVLWLARDHFLVLGISPVHAAIKQTLGAVMLVFMALASSTLLIAAVDVPFQIWSHARQLRMSRQEVRDELKETEGKPEVKGRIRSLQREIAQRRMMEELPKADVVVTNPTHYAVALRYVADDMDAPVLIAKGADLMAQRVRLIAQSHDIPIVSAPRLARAVYHNTPLGREIPAALYTAVAQVLAYAYRLRRADGPVKAPEFDDLPIPDDLRGVADGQPHDTES